MAKIFEEKSALSFGQRKEIERIEAIPSAQRTTLETNFMTGLAPYLTNEVVLRDQDENIMIAKGETVPDTYEGFAKGALFIKSNAADGTKGLYENQGTTTDADFNLIGSISGSEIDATLIQYATVTITNAEMLALRATPKTLVAAPGAGYMLEFISAELLFDYTGAYTESDDNMAVRYTDGSGAIVSQAIESTGFVDATADTITNALPKIDAIVAKSGSENKALVLHNTGDGEFGGGNAANVVRVKIAYRVHATGF